MFLVNREKCIACAQCIKDCPVSDILFQEGKAHIKNENCIKCGHCLAICPTAAISTTDYDMSEVKDYEPSSFSISSTRLLNFIKFRRSIRRFKAQAVEKEKLEQIIEAGRFTQTGSNSQDVSYIVVSEKLNELSNMTYEILYEKGRYLLAHLTPETEYLKRYATLWVQMYEAHQKDPTHFDRLFYNAPVAIIVVSPNELNGGLASSNMELMVDALGLGTYFNGFFQVAAQNNEAITQFLGLKPGQKIISCLVIGYPAVTYRRTVPRKKPEITWL